MRHFKKLPFPVTIDDYLFDDIDDDEEAHPEDKRKRSTGENDDDDELERTSRD